MLLSANYVKYPKESVYLTDPSSFAAHALYPGTPGALSQSPQGDELAPGLHFLGQYGVTLVGWFGWLVGLVGWFGWLVGL